KQVAEHDGLPEALEHDRRHRGDAQHDRDRGQQSVRAVHRPATMVSPARNGNARLAATMKIVIPGGSGQVGGILARAFRARGDDVVIVSRGGPADGTGARVVAWDARTL